MNSLEAYLAEREFYSSVQEMVQKLKSFYPDSTIHQILVHYIVPSKNMAKTFRAAEYSLVIFCFFSVNSRSRFARYTSTKDMCEFRLTKETDYDFHLEIATGKNLSYPVKAKELHYMRDCSYLYDINCAFVINQEDYKNQGYKL